MIEKTKMFFSLPLFGDNISDEEKENKLSDALSFEEGEKGLLWIEYLIKNELTKFIGTSVITNNELYNKYIVGINNLILEEFEKLDFIQYFTNSDEELEKLKILIKRKQFNAKLVLLLSTRIHYFLINVLDMKKFAIWIHSRAVSKYNEIAEDYVLKNTKLQSLKRIVDNICSGIKPQCYISFNNTVYEQPLEKCLIEYIELKFNYNLSEKMVSGLYPYNFTIEKTLSILLLGEEDIDICYTNTLHRGIYSLINYVYKENGFAHAKKILDYCFNKVITYENGIHLINNKLPLYFLYDFEDRLIDFAFEAFKNRLPIKTKFDNFEEMKGLIYPIYDVSTNKLNEGKKFFINLLSKLYSEEDYKKFIEVISNPDNVIQEAERTKRYLTVRDVLDFYLYGVPLAKYERIYCNCLNKNFDDSQSVLKRLYYRCYFIKNHCENSSIEMLYDFYYDLFNMIDTKYGTKCLFKHSNPLRDENYKKLKNILKQLGFNINDNFKDLYITALLDRKYATSNESLLFPELEQFGDAIYELAADNILFYNENSVLNHQNREKLVKADFQVKIAKNIGLAELYIANYISQTNEKYDVDARIDQDDEVGKGHYIADMLEMVIGVIGKEFGVQKALDFATNIIIKTDASLSKPLFIKYDFYENYNSNISKKYLNKIFPGDYACYIEDEYYEEYVQLFIPIAKILKICIIGNDTKEKRNEITYAMHSLRGNDNKLEFEDFYQFVVTYLKTGIENTIAEYSNLIKERYCIKDNNDL